MADTNRQEKLWNKLLTKLTPNCRAALEAARTPPQPAIAAAADTAPPRESPGFRALCRRLTPTAREAIEAAAAADDDPPTADPEAGRYCVAEQVDGEWAVTRVFKTIEALARHLGRKEGEDAVLLPFYGVPLQFTRGPQRYLIGPDGQTAYMIPLYEGAPIKTADADLVLDGMELQLDGYVGPEALAVSRGPDSPPGTAAAAAHDDDEDDNEDDEFEDA